MGHKNTESVQQQKTCMFVQSFEDEDSFPTVLATYKRMFNLLLVKP